MVCELVSHTVSMTAKLLNRVKLARSRYFNDQRDCSLQKVQSEKDQKVNNNIEDNNKKIRQLQETISSLRTFADEFAFQSEEKTNIEVKSLISKSNTLKRASTEKQCLVDTLIKPCCHKRMKKAPNEHLH